MSGVAVIRALLAANSNLTAVVPASKIIPGIIPLNTVLPAISVSDISGVQRNTLAMTNAKYMQTDRVQVTVQTKSYPTQKSILELVRKAIVNQRGTVNGIAVEAILPEGRGPDFYEADAVIFMQGTDFMVKWQANI